VNVKVGVGVCVDVDVGVGVEVAVDVFLSVNVNVDVGSPVEAGPVASLGVDVDLEKASLSALHPSVVAMNIIINNTIMYLFLYIPDI
jgi:hypothetical protein